MALLTASCTYCVVVDVCGLRSKAGFGPEQRCRFGGQAPTVAVRGKELRAYMTAVCAMQQGFRHAGNVADQHTVAASTTECPVLLRLRESAVS